MMLIAAAPCVMLFPVCVGQRLQDGDVQEMIKKLASPSFREREAATGWLLRREQAAPHVREALRSADKEVVKRAAIILDHYDRRPLRDLQAVAKQGDLQRFVQLLASWPEGKHEEGALSAAREFAVTIYKRHEKMGGPVLELPLYLTRSESPVVVSAARITEMKQHYSDWSFYRAQEINLPLVANASYLDGSLIVSSGPVRVRADYLHRVAVFAAGSVDLRGAKGSLIVSAGDVQLNSRPSKCLIIAKGNVIIGGKLFKGELDKSNLSSAFESSIIQNEPNPLGFIRFSDDKSIKSTEKAVAH